MQLYNSIVKERQNHIDAPGFNTRAALADWNFEKRLAQLARQKARRDSYKKTKMQNEGGESSC